MKFKVVGIGEVLWDLLPEGPQMGGAPVNFACHAKMLGAHAHVITRVGNDDFGREIIRRLGAMGIDLTAVQVDNHVTTGKAIVSLKDGGVPQFAIEENAAWDHLTLSDKAQKVVQDINAICFGSLAQRSESAATTIQKLVVQAPSKALKVFDVNLRQNFYTKKVIEHSLDMANVLKLNNHELAILASMFELGGLREHQIERLAGRFNLWLVALTLGEQGSLLYQAGKWSKLPGNPVMVNDTIGAGDSFTAALVMGFLCEMPLEQMHRTAASVASYVCSQPGAIPVLPEYLSQQFISCKAKEVANDPGFASSKM